MRKRTKDVDGQWDPGRPRLVQADSAAFSVDVDRTVLSWNEAAEELTGIRAAEAIGRPCWAVLRGTGPDGCPICSPECSVVLALERGEAPPTAVITVGPEGNRRRVTASTLTLDVGGERMIVHTLRELAPEREAARTGEPGAPDPLTGRQREILSLLAEGFRAGQIAGRLALSEATVRNHISSILDRLGCHSQLEAVAEARRRGLL